MSFKAARERSGLTQCDIARELEIDQSTVSLWEVGKTRPRAKILPKLARLLDCSIEELLTSNNQSAPEA